MNDTPPPSLDQLEIVFQKVVQALIGGAGIVLFVFLLIGGIKYITSGGDPKATESAQKTITYAIGGLVLLLVSYLILVLIGTITGVDVSQFKITQP